MPEEVRPVHRPPDQPRQSFHRLASQHCLRLAVHASAKTMISPTAFIKMPMPDTTE